MPIRPDLRKYYSRAAGWPAVRARILARAGGKCEQCGKPDRQKVYVYKGSLESGQYWTLMLRPVAMQRWTYCLLGGSGNFVLFPRHFHEARRIRVVITIAHLNHNPADNSDTNLKALCQWCHFHHDKLHHRQSRAAHKDAKRPILVAAASGVEV